MGAQWIAWRIHLPSILLLLIAGIVAGPVTGFLDPDALLGDLLLPIVSISVGIILFEGGLTLKIKEVSEHGAVVRRLVSRGVVVTWVLTALGARYLAGLDWGLSILLGAILVVTGPTVIMPLLRHVRPSPATGSVLKWEGILNDPIGAILAVLVFEALLAGSTGEAASIVAQGVIRAVLIGSLVGLLMAGLLVVLLKRRMIPEHLQSPLTLMLVVAAFAASNVMQEESGLLAVTLAGVVLANQRMVNVTHIVEFKENLRVLLIASLFILLAARLSPGDLAYVTVGSVAFLAFLMLVVRPATILACTNGSSMSWRERLFLMWLAPRGIVAAAVASFFGLRLADAGYPGAEALAPLMFLVIIGTVTIYGLGAKPVATALGIARRDPQGTLIVGAHPWARTLAGAIRDAGHRVVMADQNRENIQDARDEGFDTYPDSVLAEYARDELDLEDVGHLLALTPNDEVNALTCLHFEDVFGKSHVFLLPPRREDRHVARELRGRYLFDRTLTYGELSRRIATGASIETRRFTASEDRDSAVDQVRTDGGVPLFLASGQALRMFTPAHAPSPEPDDCLVYLTPVPPTGKP